MDDIQLFVDKINALTHELTDRWPNAFPAVNPGGGVINVSVGPMAFTGFPLNVHMPQHNFKGSIQVNIDIDLREYHSLINWYADSEYARASNAPPNEQQIYAQIKDDIRDAVNAGRTITQIISAGQTPLQRDQAGNFRGLRGWITHLALYLKRGMIGALAGSKKNLVPILIKSPNNILTQYGMTTDELNYFNNNRYGIMDQILQQIGRAPLAGRALNTIDVFGADPGRLNLDDLSNPARTVVPLAGTPILTAPNLGPWRTGNQHVRAIQSTLQQTRNGFVAEFRSLPGYYDGVASWRALGLEFLKQANTRNARNGITP
jgi:hypothetical protein